MATADPFQKTFKTLRAILKPYEPKLTVVMNEPRKYYLGSTRTKTKSGSLIWFGGVQIMKNYVTFHFIPVYANPALRDTLSPSLLKRMQGKGCFNFTDVDPVHVKELEAVTKRGFAGFIKQFP
jgi:hypothetical protein